MRKKHCRLAALLLAVLLCLTALPVSASAAGDAMSLDQVKALMNAEPLYPQKTGYVELDRMLEELVAPYRGKDTYTTLKGLYEWTVNNIDYSWNGYSQNYAPAYDCFTLTYDLTYETGLPQAYPIDMIYRAYHMLTARTGVCYDWGILFAVMARYVGVESYVHTGILRIGTWTGHHGWTELRLGGKNYIFDGQHAPRGRAPGACCQCDGDPFPLWAGGGRRHLCVGRRDHPLLCGRPARGGVVLSQQGAPQPGAILHLDPHRRHPHLCAV